MARAEATSVPSFILIHSTVWSQYINVTDRQDKTRQQSDSIGRTVLQAVAQKRPTVCQVYKYCFAVLQTGTHDYKHNKSSAVAEMGDRGHNRHGPKKGGCHVPFAESWDPSNRMRLGRRVHPYQVASSSTQPFGHNIHESKTGELCPF